MSKFDYSIKRYYREYVGRKYSVRFYVPVDVRYIEGDRSVMLLTEVVDKIEERGKWLYIFPNLINVIYFPKFLISDSGEAINAYDAVAIRNRVREAAEVVLGNFEISVEGSHGPLL